MSNMCGRGCINAVRCIFVSVGIVDCWWSCQWRFRFMMIARSATAGTAARAAGVRILHRARVRSLGLCGVGGSDWCASDKLRLLSRLGVHFALVRF